VTTRAQIRRRIRRRMRLVHDARLLSMTRCRKCKRMLNLTAEDVRSVGFRCMFCKYLFCNRCGKKHFGSLDGYSKAKWRSRHLLAALREWLSATGDAHANRRRR
jgi:IBR domain, a half RING-finger domain